MLLRMVGAFNCGFYAFRTSESRDYTVTRGSHPSPALSLTLGVPKARAKSCCATASATERQKKKNELARTELRFAEKLSIRKDRWRIVSVYGRVKGQPCQKVWIEPLKKCQQGREQRVAVGTLRLCVSSPDTPFTSTANVTNLGYGVPRKTD